MVPVTISVSFDTVSNQGILVEVSTNTRMLTINIYLNSTLLIYII